MISTHVLDTARGGPAADVLNFEPFKKLLSPESAKLPIVVNPRVTAAPVVVNDRTKSLASALPAMSFTPAIPPVIVTV